MIAVATEAHEVAANIKANLSDILTLDHALAHLDKIGMTLAEVGMQVRANTAEALLNRANALRHRADRLVFQEVGSCMSSLVATLASGFDSISRSLRDLSDLTERAYELTVPLNDYESAAREAGWEPTPDDAEIQKHGEDETCFGADRWRVACERDDIEPHELEVYEHWAVSAWLAEKLDAKGERVDTDFTGLNVWARTTTGQAIAADAVILAIAADLERTA